MVRVARLSLLAVLALLPHAGAAYGASSESSPGDPPAGSPSAAVYELPFEKGRADAAPKGSGGTSAEDGGAGGGGSSGGSGSAGSGSAGSGSAGESEGSFYRSENNFGSSSQVPGVAAGGAAAAGGSGSGSGPGAGAGAGAGGGSGGGASGALPGIQSGADTGNTSVGANLALLALIVLVAAGVGYFSVRSRRLNAQP